MVIWAGALHVRWNIYDTTDVLRRGYAPLDAQVPHARGGPIEAQREEYCDDESYRRMDEWLDGRRDVDLAGDRHSGGGPARRRDQQPDQKIAVHYPRRQQTTGAR